MDWNLMDMEEEHQQAFGEHTGIDEDVLDNILSIKDNSDEFDDLHLSSEETENFTNLAWRLFGRYIANNTHLKEINLDNCSITDEKAASLFKELTRSVSLERLDMDGNSFGVEGIRSMIPLLQNSLNLSTLYLDSNRNINSECFGLVVSALHGKSVADLFVGDCNITDISALETHNLPNLRELILNENNIGKEGCQIMANLLQKEGSTLTEVFLIDTGIDDEGTELLATSLKHNTTLKKLNLCNKGITAKGHRAFLKLLVDVSSIGNTYNSNSTLTECSLIEYGAPNSEMQVLINSACKMNRMNSNPGRAKVIKYQLNSRNRKKLCELQGIEYSTNNIADVEPILLPKILALIGDRHGQSELYIALIPTAPDLLSYIDRKAKLNDVLVKNAVQATSLAEELANNLAKYERKVAALKTEYSYQTSRLTTHNVEVNHRLELIDLGDKKQSSSGGKSEGNVEAGSSSSKKQRTS